MVVVHTFSSLNPALTAPFWGCPKYLPQLHVLHSQKNSRRLWRSQRRESSSVPEGGADFPAAISLPENAQTLAGIAFRAAGKSVKNFPAASKFAGKLFQQGISDSHCLPEFSDIGVAQTVFLVNRVFRISSPAQKGPFWRK